MNKYLIYNNETISIKVLKRQRLEINYILPNTLINFDHPEENDVDYIQNILNSINFNTNTYSIDNLEDTNISNQLSLNKMSYKKYEKIILYICDENQVLL